MYRLSSKKCHFIYLLVNKMDEYSRKGLSSIRPHKILGPPLKCVFFFKFATHASLLENRKLLIFSMTYLIGEKVDLKKKKKTKTLIHGDDHFSRISFSFGKENPL